MNSHEATILSKCIDFDQLFRMVPEKFNFKNLSISDKISLLESNFEKYKNILDFKNFSTNDKALVVLTGSRGLGKLTEFSPEEFLKLEDWKYCKLLELDFTKHITAERVSKMQNVYKERVFITYPAWFLKSNLPWPKLSARAVSQLAYNNIKCVEKNIDFFAKLPTESGMWCKLIKKDKSHGSKFLDNIEYCITKTDARRVFQEHPYLIKEITADQIIKSKLSVKELILLFSRIMNNRRNAKIFQDWKFSDELVELFRLELTAEVISGVSKTSMQLKTAMGILKHENTENKNETKTME